MFPPQQFLPKQPWESEKYEEFGEKVRYPNSEKASKYPRFTSVVPLTILKTLIHSWSIGEDQDVFEGDIHLFWKKCVNNNRNSGQ